MKNTKAFFYASLASSLFAFGLMMLGAYTRLSDAGLGCPDWPGCYGHWMVDAKTAMNNPSLHWGKAWTEMLHRYMAGLLGLGIAGLMAAQLKRAKRYTERVLPLFIGIVLLFQALLGMWTVTLKLWPVVVMGHLMGGMLLLSLLWVTTLHSEIPPPALLTLWPVGPLLKGGDDTSYSLLQNKRLRILVAFTLLILILQIALGGWTSAHYAALVCPDFPTCHKTTSLVWDFKGAFNLKFIPGGVELLSANALKTIHMLHRLGAGLCVLFIAALARILWIQKSDDKLRPIAIIMGTLMALQITLGIANVLAKLPLAVAVAHHGVAALLLLTLITLNVILYRSIGYRAGTETGPYNELEHGLAIQSPPFKRGSTGPKAGGGIFRTHEILNDYLTLCKPKVVLMMLITAFAGMCLSTQGTLPWMLCFKALLGIGLCSGAAAVLNHVIDRKLDAQMIRTHHRPMAQERIGLRQALIFSGVLASTGFGLLIFQVNALCAALTLLACIGYALVYSLILKHQTPQNIVIGGAAGAMPPLLGWVALCGEIQALAWLPVLIIFAWTPPHFWALAIAREAEYQKAHIPMLPITHGVAYTKLSMLLYTVLLVIVSLLPYTTGLSGIYYLIAACCLGMAFLTQMIRLYQNPSKRIAAQSFGFSILYLLLLFVALLADHFFNTSIHYY